jgi:hypothetical protein
MDTSETINETFDFINSLRLDYIGINVLCPDPGTKVYKDCFKDKVIVPEYTGEDSFLEPLGMPVVCKNFNKKELSKFISYGNNSFYSNRQWYNRQQKKKYDKL